MNQLYEIVGSRKVETAKSIVDILIDSNVPAKVSNFTLEDFAINYADIHSDWLSGINDLRRNRSFMIDKDEKMIYVIKGSLDNYLGGDLDKLANDTYFFSGTIKDALKEFENKGYSFAMASNAWDYCNEKYSEQTKSFILREYKSIFHKTPFRDPDHLFVETKKTNVEELFS